MKTTITIEVEIEVEFRYHKASRGHRDKYGAPEEPDEDASLEFVKATWGEKEIPLPFELNRDQLEIAERQAWDEIEEQANRPFPSD